MKFRTISLAALAALALLAQAQPAWNFGQLMARK